MSAFRVLIVDGEPLARSHMRRLLTSRSDFTIVGEVGTAAGLRESIDGLRPDLVFLDLDIPGLARSDARNVAVVTSSSSASIEPGTGVRAIDHLLKPFDRERFDRVLRRVSAVLNPHEKGLKSQYFRLLTEFPEHADSATSVRRLGEGKRRYLDRVLVRNGDRIFFLKVDDIDSIEAAGRITRVRCADGNSHILAQSLDRLAEVLDPRQFLSVRRSTIINLERFDELGSPQRLARSS